MGRRHLAASVALAGTLFLLVTPAQSLAQGNTWAGADLERMIDAAGWRLGPLRVNAAFTLANAGYDTDIFFGYLDEPVPDWTLTAGAPAQIFVPLGRKIVLDLSDSPEYMFYVETENERAWNNTFRGNIHISLDRIYVRAGGGSADVRRRFSPELDIHVRERLDSLDGLVLWQTSEATSFSLICGWDRYGYGDAEYLGATVSGMLDREERFLDLVAYVQPGPRTRLSLDGQYGTYSFTGGESVIDSARSTGIFAGVEFLPRTGGVGGGAGLRGSLSLGYTRLDIADPGLTDGSGFAGEARLSIDLARRTSARVAYSRGFRFSIYAGATYYMSTLYGVGLAQRLSRRATLSYDVMYTRTSYPDEGDIQGPRDRFLSHLFGLNVRIARRLEVAFMGSLGSRFREDIDLARSRAFFGLSLTYGHQPSAMSSPVSGPLR